MPDTDEIAARFNTVLKLYWPCKKIVDIRNTGRLVATCEGIGATFWGLKNVKYSDPNAAVCYGIQA